MDINVFRAVILITLLISFVGLWVWAWSRKRKPAFHEASMLPLEEDNGHIPNFDGPNFDGSNFEDPEGGPVNGQGSESC